MSLTARRHRRTGQTSGGGVTPSPIALDAILKRFAGGSGSVAPWGSLVFRASDNVTVEQLSTLRVFVSGVEQRLGVHPSRGRFANGGLRSCLFRLESRSIADATAIPAAIHFGGNARATSDIAFEAVTAAEVFAPVAVVPHGATNAPYLCATRCTLMPLNPETEYREDEAAFFGTLFEDAVSTWVDFRWAQYNVVDGTFSPQWNLDQTAGYQVARGYWTKWCTTGDSQWWYRGMRHLQNMFSGYAVNAPAEQWSPWFMDQAIGYLLTGCEAYWENTVVTAITNGGLSHGDALSSGVEATAKSRHVSPDYGIRYNVKFKWSAIGCLVIDGKSATADRAPDFATELPWMIDSFAAVVYDVAGHECLDGLTGMRSDVGGEDPLGYPIFQISVINQWYLDYFNNVQADSRIPPLIKANLDVLRGQLNALGGGALGHAYVWSCPKDAEGADRSLLGMHAAAAAFCAALFDTEGSTTYGDLYTACIKAGNLSISSDVQYNATKLTGENFGWSRAAPAYRAHGVLGAPTTIREPVTY